MSDVQEKTFLEQKADVDELLQRINTDDGDHDKFSHIVDKEKLGHNIFEGQTLVALCGKVMPPQRSDTEGRTICQECKDEFKKRTGVEFG